MNIVPTLTDLWLYPLILGMIRASVLFNNPPPETLEIHFKNENIVTNNCRAYGKKKIQGNKTGVDE